MTYIKVLVIGVVFTILGILGYYLDKGYKKDMELMYRKYKLGELSLLQRFGHLLRIIDDIKFIVFGVIIIIVWLFLQNGF